MHAMQYHVKLPSDYNMEIIRDRVRLNGYKTDGFKNLIIKAYLISQTTSNCITNTYSPLYLWRSSEGMTEFIFNGFYDNVISSFGWQNINIGVIYSMNITDSVKHSLYALEEYIDIFPTLSLKEIEIKKLFRIFDNAVAEIIIYNPDKWKFVKYSFIENLPKSLNPNIKIYDVLYISQ
ncbi:MULTISPECIES: DUF4865 family protein [Staphylococcus]|uniref:DUF4865 family protein n=11 Tax=Staphylococcus aureus TaxID=1280 RepID=M1XHV1_STAAU|nr:MULTISPECIES: DUF4865 family protein [Staphylococcus]HDH6200878.1 DUF4865 family protein [Staphylococcus aureus LTCF-15-62]HDH6209190.1 DUF4865 family protein [Staphylococcus aureus LTCF-14-59]HDH6281279.1 DUF4865 family protein [Staphylococcus aureus LTCF-3-23]HDK8313028.1 DUF4865 family protein [Staphylococcus aureus subsp. aureus ST22]AHZ98025.1 Petrobactin biosynthesis protein AsbA [Staphylococcus aureus]